jgi:hypothetical protein
MPSRSAWRTCRARPMAEFRAPTPTGPVPKTIAAMVDASVSTVDQSARIASSIGTQRWRPGRWQTPPPRRSLPSSRGGSGSSSSPDAPQGDPLIGTSTGLSPIAWPCSSPVGDHTIQGPVDVKKPTVSVSRDSSAHRPLAAVRRLGTSRSPIRCPRGPARRSHGRRTAWRHRVRVGPRRPRRSPESRGRQARQ